MSEEITTQVKQDVRRFYDEVGWQQVSDGVYQNAHYEDLRAVSRDYIHNCHLRILRHLNPTGTLLLDAGSGPIQYPEYLQFSKGYQKRVCADISITALQEARNRIGAHGLFVVADVAQLPFKPGVFDGLVSLHTIHHLPAAEHVAAYNELHRVLDSGAKAVVVNGWDQPLFGRIFETPIRARKWLRRRRREMRGQPVSRKLAQDTGTFVKKYDAAWLKAQLGASMPVEIFVWRSVSVMVLRFYIHAALGGRFWLRLLYSLEERFPRFFGKYGQYPMVVFQKRV
jgi:SAM-dependent methyltransferase